MHGFKQENLGHFLLALIPSPYHRTFVDIFICAQDMKKENPFFILTFFYSFLTILPTLTHEAIVSLK